MVQIVCMKKYALDTLHWYCWIHPFLRSLIAGKSDMLILENRL